MENKNRRLSRRSALKVFIVSAGATVLATKPPLLAFANGLTLSPDSSDLDTQNQATTPPDQGIPECPNRYTLKNPIKNNTSLIEAGFPQRSTVVQNYGKICETLGSRYPQPSFPESCSSFFGSMHVSDPDKQIWTRFPGDNGVKKLRVNTVFDPSRGRVSVRIPDVVNPDHAYDVDLTDLITGWCSAAKEKKELSLHDIDVMGRYATPVIGFGTFIYLASRVANYATEYAGDILENRARKRRGEE